VQTLVSLDNFERMLNQPSENELLGMMHLLGSDDNEHLVMVGDSTVWGVSADFDESFAGLLSTRLGEDSAEVVNLAVPGMSFLDEYAVIENLWNPHDTYIVFINPIWFHDRYNDKTPEDYIRFPQLVSRYLSESAGALEECCNFSLLAGKPPLQRAITDVVMRYVPLFRNRDLVNKQMLGMQPSIAENTILHRIAAMNFAGAIQREELAPDEGDTEEKETALALDIEKSRSFGLLKHVLSLSEKRDNVHYVILDDNWYERTALHKESMNKLEQLFEGRHVLNVHNAFEQKHYFGNGYTHLNSAGHILMTDLLYDFLYAN